jgi:hypothetical protein
LSVGRPVTIELGVKDIEPGSPAVRWSATASEGVSLSAPSGAFAGSPPSGGCASPTAETQSLTVEADTPGSFTVAVTMATSTGTALPPVVLDVTATT